MNAAKSVSVVVPVYNSEECLPDLVVQLEAVLSKLTSEFELILVNDGSRDRSGQVAERLAREHPWVSRLDLMRNYGQHNALLCGIRAARHDIVVTMDDDLQNPPKEIGLLLEKLGQGYDVVYGSPQHEQHGLWRALSSMTTKLVLQRVLGADTARHVSAFRAFRTNLRDAFADYRGPSVNIDVLLSWATTRFAAMPVRHNPRQAGKSSYGTKKLIEHALNMLTGFSTVPLQLASILGFVLTLFGLVLLCFVLGRYLLQGVSVPGFTFLASIIIIFSGAQLFTLGVIGEYLARMHFRMMERPAYVVRAGGEPSAADETASQRTADN